MAMAAGAGAAIAVVGVATVAAGVGSTAEAAFMEVMGEAASTAGTANNARLLTANEV